MNSHTKIGHRENAWKINLSGYPSDTIITVKTSRGLLNLLRVVIVCNILDCLCCFWMNFFPHTNPHSHIQSFSLSTPWVLKHMHTNIIFTHLYLQLIVRLPLSTSTRCYCLVTLFISPLRHPLDIFLPCLYFHFPSLSLSLSLSHPLFLSLWQPLLTERSRLWKQARGNVSWVCLCVFHPVCLQREDSIINCVKHYNLSDIYYVTPDSGLFHYFC